jgi:H/ACA ribonucleoprotein complex subunit 4
MTASVSPVSPPASTPALGPAVRDRIAHGAFLLVDKPRGPGSHQVTAWVRDLLGVERAGHAGTLDPNVSGLLWVGVGPALKLLPLLLEFPKRYVAVIDCHGPVARRELERVLHEFEGEIYQTPPVRSAVRRERRIRTIHRLSLLEAHGAHHLIEVNCESGTYVRTLAVDLGEALGVGAHLAELRRTGTGPFREDQSTTLHALADAAAESAEGRPDALLRLLHPMEEVGREFPQVVLKDGAAGAVAHGAGVAKGGIRSVSQPFPKGGAVVLVSAGGELLGYGEAQADSSELSRVKHGWVISPRRVLADPRRFPPSWSTARKPRPPPPAPPPASADRPADSSAATPVTDP